MRWVVKAFINGLIDDELHSAMRAARRRNQSMTLGQAYEELIHLRSPGNALNSDCIAGPKLAAKAENSVDEFSTIMLFPVSYMSPDILSDPVAFSQFFINHRARPFYQSSGPFSRQSIQELHAAYREPPQAKCAENAGVANAGPAETVPVTTNANQTNENSGKPDSHFEIAAAASAITIVLEDNNGRVLPYGHDLSVPGGPEAVSEPMAIESGACGVTLRAAGYELGVSRNAEEHLKAYRNITGEKEVEKWREKGDGRIEGDVVYEQDVSTMDLGANTYSCAPDLVDPRWNLEAVEAAGEQDEEGLIALVTSGGKDRCAEVDKHGTTEKLDNSYRPHISHAITDDAIRNPSLQPVRTASEWDPGPRESDGEIVVARGNWINRVLFGDLQLVDQEPQEVEPKFRMAKAAVPDQGNIAAQFLWRPDDEIRLEHQIPLTQSISILNTRLGQHCPSSWSPTTQPAGVGSGSSGKGSISGNRRKITKVVAKNGSGDSAQNTPNYPLYFEIWQGLRGGIRGRRIWDPGGEEAKFLLAVGRGG